jgi:CheY-like chemotaxis protein
MANVKYILVVEDDGDTLKLIAATLSRAGYAVTTAANGLEGNRQLRARRYDLVISNYMMPHICGSEFYAWASLIQPHLRDRFIFMTAAANLSQCRQDLESSLKDPRFLLKPFSPSDLTAQVKERLAAPVDQPQIMKTNGRRCQGSRSGRHALNRLGWVNVRRCNGNGSLGFFMEDNNMSEPATPPYSPEPKDPEASSSLRDELITPENLTKERLKAILESAYMDIAYDKDGDLKARDACVFFIFPRADRIHMLALFSFKPESSREQRLEFVNHVNEQYIMVSAFTGQNNLLRFTYDLMVLGGVTPIAFVLVARRFASIPRQACADLGKELF